MTELKYWLKGEARQNFGDYLSEFLMQELFYDLRPDDVEMRLIGSCIHDSFVPGSYFPDETDPEPTAVFWGCGIREKGGLSVEGRKRADIRAVRGPISANELRLGGDFAMGDPALMLPALYAPKQRSSFVGKSVCIPHFHDDRSDETILEATGADIVLRPNIPNGNTHLLSFIDALTSADFILTASLHGAIVAAAYQVSFAYWRSASIDLPLKWEDFSRSVGIEAKFVDDVEEGKRVHADTIKQQIALPSTLALLAAAPFPLKASGLVAVLRYELGRTTPDKHSSVLGDFASALARYQEDIDQLVAESAALLNLHRGEEGSLRHFRQVIDQIADLCVKTLDVAIDEESPSAETKLTAILAEAQRQRATLEWQAAQLDSLFRMTSDGEVSDLPLGDQSALHVARLKQLIKEHHQLQMNLSKLEGELALSHGEAEALRAQISGETEAANARWRAAVQERETLEQEISNLQQSLDATVAERLQLVEHLADLNAQQGVSAKVRETLEQQVANLQQSLDATVAERLELADRVANLDIRHSDLQQQNAALSDEIAGLNSQRTAWLHERDGLIHHLDAARDHENVIADLQRTLDAERAEHDFLSEQAQQAARNREAWELEREAVTARQLESDWQAKAARHEQRRSNRELVRHLVATQAQQRIDALRRNEAEAAPREPVSLGERMLDRAFARSGAASARAQEAQTEQAMQFIAASGLFDSGWYERQIGGTADHGDALRHYVTVGGRDGASPHPLFDPVHYAAQILDASTSSSTPLEHYLTVGWLQGLSPHPLFDPAHYFDQAPEVAMIGTPPLSDYIKRGWRNGINPHPLFNVEFYLEQNLDVKEVEVEPLSHYLEWGWRESRSPHPLIDMAAYLNRNPDLVSANCEPLKHYLAMGRFEGRRIATLIDPSFYEETSGIPGADAVLHYLQDGCHLGLKPNAVFDSKFYALTQAQEISPDEDPLRHFVEKGWRQGAWPSPLFDTAFYLSSDEHLATSGRDPLSHYLERGWREGRSPHPVLDIASYIEKNPDIATSGQDPLSHYLRWGWREGRSISHLFHDGFYRDQCGTSLGNDVIPLVDYLQRGWKHALAPHPLFDVKFYRYEYLREESEAVDPLIHFMANARYHQYSASPLFDPVFYLAHAPDVAATGENALLHYVMRGGAEGRAPNPVFHAVGYIFDHPDVAEFDGNPLSHYLIRGRDKGYSPHPLFDPAFYLDSNLDVRAAGADPYTHFVSYGRSERRQASEELIEGRAPHEVAIRLPDVPEPEVTVIIPVYRSFFDTFRCLYSLSEALQSGTKLQVVLADDCPERPVEPLFADISNLKIISNTVNHGFLRNCNEAAAQTGGEFIVFLNNDTVVRDGWLETLLDLAHSNPRNAMIGCKLLNRDGTIQEAGGIMFKDGWGYPYGRGDAANRPQYNYVREVDCVIGACFLIRRSVFEEVGGFDDIYYPAFFEEFDLAMAVAEAGYRVLYQPACEVVHLGSASYGAEMRDRQSIKNQAQFKNKWATQLATRYDGPQEIFLARDGYHKSGTILIIDDFIPEFDKHAGALTMYQYMDLLVRLDFKVIFFPHVQSAELHYASIYQKMGIEILYGNIDLSNWLSENGKYLDWVWVARPDVASHYIDMVRAQTAARLVYYTHDLHFLREQRRYEVDGDEWALAESKRLEPLESEIFRVVDCVMTPSDEEAIIIADIAPGQTIQVLTPYFFGETGSGAAHPGKPLRTRREIIFVGGYRHVPNVDAAIRLVRSIMPLVWQQEPEVKVLLVGSHPPQEVMALGDARVNVVGFVEDLGPWYARARASVSPLRYGAGVKGKIVGSLEAGVPVVTTPIGNEGLGLLHGVEAMIGETDEEIAAHIVRLFRDEALLGALETGGSAVIRTRFAEEEARDRLLSALNLQICNVCGTRKRAPMPAEPSDNWREAPACPECWALNRMRILADVVLRPYRKYGVSSIQEALPFLRELRIHEFGFVGPIHDRLKALPGFTSSDFFPDVPLGKLSANGVMCQDLQHLTFADGELDLCISQDVFEHVPDPWKGFREVHRVLNASGRHIFTIPYCADIDQSVIRAVLEEDELTHILPPEYHGDPIRDEGALVFTDFGRDIIEKLEQIGFSVSIMEVRQAGVDGGYSVVFSTTKSQSLDEPIALLMDDNADVALSSVA